MPYTTFYFYRSENMDLKGTKTESNLLAAFAGESQARNKYTYFASVAKKEGYEQISELFIKTAENEKEHAKLWFRELNLLGDTKENLLHAAEGENYEWTDMYENFAKDAGCRYQLLILPAPAALLTPKIRCNGKMFCLAEAAHRFYW